MSSDCNWGLCPSTQHLNHSSNILSACNAYSRGGWHNKLGKSLEGLHHHTVAYKQPTSVKRLESVGNISVRQGWNKQRGLVCTNVSLFMPSLSLLAVSDDLVDRPPDVRKKQVLILLDPVWRVV